MRLPKHPIYIPSKGRAGASRTYEMLYQLGIKSTMVVEPQDEADYVAKHGKENILILPFSNTGTVTDARNWIKQHASAHGHARHWQMDDNIRSIMRVYMGTRFKCNAAPLLAAVEDFVNRYSNIEAAGIGHAAFSNSRGAPFRLNQQVYSCMLIDSFGKSWWSGPYGDTDFSLRILTGGNCTVLFNAFVIDKVPSMQMGGGNTPLYKQDGKLKRAEYLNRKWPGFGKMARKNGMPYYDVKSVWRRFPQRLLLKSGIKMLEVTPDEYGMSMNVVKPLKSGHIKRIMEGYNSASSA